MDVSVASWLVVVLAIAGANLPFVNQQAFAFVPLKKRGAVDAGGKAWRKPFYVRLAEMIVLYFIVGAIAVGLEGHLGNAFPQTWEFYAITGCLFIVLGFPGFVVRYLRKRH